MVYELQSFGIRVVIVEPGNIKTTFRSEKAAKVTKNSPYYTMTRSTVDSIEGIL